MTDYYFEPRWHKRCVSGGCRQQLSVAGELFTHAEVSSNTVIPHVELQEIDVENYRPCFFYKSHV